MGRRALRLEVSVEHPRVSGRAMGRCRSWRRGGWDERYTGPGAVAVHEPLRKVDTVTELVRPRVWR